MKKSALQFRRQWHKLSKVPKWYTKRLLKSLPKDKLQELTKKVIKDNDGRIDSTEINTLENNDKHLSIYILDNALNDKLTKNLMNELSSKKEVLSISLNKESKKSIYEDEEL